MKETNKKTIKYAVLVSLVIALAVASFFSYRVIMAGEIFHEAVHLEESGKLAEAKKGYEKALRFNPRHADAYYQLGSIMKKEGNIKEALRLMQRAAELNKEEPDYFLGIGFVYFNYLDDNKKAKDNFYRAYALDDKNFYTCFMLGKAEESDRNIEKAIYYYSKATEINPESAVVIKQLAYLHDLKGLDEQARIYWQSVLKLNPEDEEAKSYLGTSH